MKSTKYIPLHLLLGLVIGILISQVVQLHLVYILSYNVLFISILIYLYFKYKQELIKDIYFSISTIFLFIGIGILSFHLSTDRNFSNHYSHFLAGTNKAQLIVDEVLKDNDFFHNYNAHVIEINSYQSSGIIRLSVLKDSANRRLAPGDKIVLMPKFDSISPPKNPYEFNYANYLKKRQIDHQITIPSKEIQVISSKKTSLKYYANTLRNKIINSLRSAGLQGNDLTIAEALLLGKREHLSNELMEDYRDAGAIHILALSGLHIGILLWILHLLLKPLLLIRYGKFLKFVIIITILWSYAILTGMSPSILRAVTMFSALSIAFLDNESLSAITTIRMLVISAFVLLLINPYYLWDVGFQLSYIAVFFIVWLHPLFKKIWRPKNIILSYFWNILTVSFAAQLGVLPISVYYFHQFPGLFFISNILIIPILGIIISIGLLLIIWTQLSAIPELLLSVFQFLIRFMNTIVAWVSEQEAFLFKNLYLSLLSVVLIYISILLISTGLKAKRFFYLKAGFIFIILFQLSILYHKYECHRYNELVIFNKSRTTLVALKKGADFNPLYTSSARSYENETWINPYLTYTKTDYKDLQQNHSNLLVFNNKKMLIIDSISVNAVKVASDYILLVNSPHVNLERLLEVTKPTLVIADASNYKSHAKLWQKTCKNHNIKFHYTVTKGAFMERFHE